MRGRMQAMIVASSIALLSLLMPPVSVISSATVGLVSLRRGAKEGLFILGCSSLVTGILGYFAIGSFQFAMLYVMVLWIPIWLIAIVLRESRSLSLAIQVATGVGILGVISFYLYEADPTVIWKALLTQMIPADAPVVELQQKIDMLVHYMTGIISAGSVCGLLFGLFIARWWQANLFNPGGFKQEYLLLQSTTKLSIGSVGVVGLALSTSGIVSEIAWNSFILLFVLFAITGTSVLHTVCSKVKLARFVVPMFYITLFLIPHALLLVALVGLSDPWLNLRKIESTHA